ncbi:MAG: PspA/IM30 family protein [Acidobacteriota bacterium]
MSIFARLFKVFQSEAHSAVDQLENPIKMTEQGIRDLKQSLQEALSGLAQVKSTAIRLKKDAEHQRRLASEYERKAMLLLQRAQSGEIDATEADSLATQALTKKEEAGRRAGVLEGDHQGQQNAADALQTKVEKLKRDISRYEAELVTLRARARTADSMKKVNKQLAGIDSSSTIAMLEKMKHRVEEQEALAQAYGEITDGHTSVDQQIDAALEGAETEAAARDSLAALKAKMGIEAGGGAA